MIIGINGKIGSGKDTVGKIIQWLTKPELDDSYIGFQTYDDITLNRVSDWKIKKFAGKLKQIGSILTGISKKHFEDQEFKKTLLGPEWGTVKSNPLNSIPVFEHVQFNELMSVREFLQKLGTEAMRDGLHENVWINALFADYKHSKTCNCKKGCRCAHDLPNWIITDMRFPNELEAVVERKGITIRVVRPHGYTNPHTGEYKEMPLSYHPSETALDDAEFDYEIINDGTIEDLIEKIKEILIKEKIMG
jgi:hypothetical protein